MEHASDQKNTDVQNTYLANYSELLVRATPPITDPRELETILHFSLRGLWGELETHSVSLSVHRTNIGAKDQAQNTNDKIQEPILKVVCRQDSAEAVRAALTWTTLPPYMERMQYRLDVVSVED